MGRKNKKPKEPTLEEQLAELDREAPGDDRSDAYAESYAREWKRKRRELLDAILRRDRKVVVDPGRDITGNFGVSPFAARGHKVQAAPRELRSSPETTFPKRVITQRVIDRLKTRGSITATQAKAAEYLWDWWNAAITGDRLVAAYEPVTVHASPNTDRLVTKRMEAAEFYLDLMSRVPYRCRGVVTHVVINDWELSTWGRDRGFSSSHSAKRGGKLLSQGLSALAASLGY